MAALQKMRVRYPSDIRYAIELYYSQPCIGNKEIKQLFGGCSSATVCRLKKIALNKMAEKNIMPWTAYSIDTETAYEAWGLDIADLENRYKKLKKLSK